MRGQVSLLIPRPATSRSDVSVLNDRNKLHSQWTHASPGSSGYNFVTETNIKVILAAGAELYTGRVDPRVGSGRVGSAVSKYQKIKV